MTANEREAVIEVRDVRRYFKNVKAVDGVDLRIRQGEYVALLGPNGAGKTTLVEIIEGIQQPDSGEIKIMNKSWNGNESDLRKKMGISLQETYFVDKLRVIEILNIFAAFYNQRESVSEEILTIIGMQDKRKSYFMNLSGGQKQRLALGVALINKPEILILDEPTTGLDPQARREIWNIVRQLKKTNTTLILTTHYMEEAEYLCNRVIIMDKGKFIAEGTLDELLTRYAHRELILFSTEMPVKDDLFDNIPGVIKTYLNLQGNGGCIFVKSITVTLPVVLKKLEENGIKLEKLECRRMNLNDLFLALTGRSLDDSTIEDTCNFAI
ncbi:MAG: ABC transporter ATP-binding protein [Candidatus Fischerbacteria bacterium RBG_13_37_8]|uniref:ABC transporter ATP-binding protein n=1 Tax=Candidatus Fischerbacteria bacterium RBG_13_37_8 TaxID=1817863 RepID=A0A1F5VXU6_9BACT|nr:MAG: ABC transporter ATP-binding protein [Candidatus Fischerbacteria bacterium RBG_13_37_8]